MTCNATLKNKRHSFVHNPLNKVECCHYRQITLVSEFFYQLKVITYYNEITYLPCPLQPVLDLKNITTVAQQPKKHDYQHCKE